MSRSLKKHYAERDIIEQMQHYVDHVEAMTAEGLHSKSDIAAELAHRDMEIERLAREIARITRGDVSNVITTLGDALTYIGRLERAKALLEQELDHYQHVAAREVAAGRTIPHSTPHCFGNSTKWICHCGKCPPPAILGSGIENKLLCEECDTPLDSMGVHAITCKAAPEKFSKWSVLDYIKTEEDLEAYVQARIEGEDL